MKVLINNKTYEFDQPITLLEISKQLKLENVIAAEINGRMYELSRLIELEQDNLTINFLDLTNGDAVRVYEASLRYVFAMALYELDPKLSVRFNYSISRSILAVIEPEIQITNDFLTKLTNKVDELIEKDLPIKRVNVSKEEAIKIYKKLNLTDKIDTLKYREEEHVHLYQCGDYYNYMFSHMVPTTGSLKQYEVMAYSPGFLIRYPRSEAKGQIPPFTDAPTFGRTLKDAHYWGKIIGGNTIAKINEYTTSRDKMVEFVALCEAKHNNQLTEVTNLIEERDDVRLILVAGPSSSGKTTFTNRLKIQLMTKGIKPVMISMDDYYLGKDQAPKDSDGNPDLEHVEALDIELFNKDMLSLVQGEEVRLPKFNFMTGKREEGEVIRVEKNRPLLIEGIHALNDRLTNLIPKHQKYKIYIAPQTQLHIDNHNPISITDLRMLRRSVRDVEYRNSPVTMTMDMWSSVRRGEFLWIYPHQESSDYVFNSELTYEYSILKRHALKHLLEIPRDNHHFIKANRLVKFLKYFNDIDEDLVPNTSLLREFIGGSPFHD